MNKKEYINTLLEAKGYTGNLTNFDACKKCKGFCCYRNACSCAPCDVIGGVTKENILKMLESGKYMITASYKIDTSIKDGLPIRALPHLSAREVNAGEIHISLIHSKCVNLGPNGCTLDENERPTQGLMLIPKEKDECDCLMPFPSELWEEYQELLEEIVIERTGKMTQHHFWDEIFELREKLIGQLNICLLFNEKLSYQEYDALKAIEIWNGLKPHHKWALNQVKLIMPDYKG